MIKSIGILLIGSILGLNAQALQLKSACYYNLSTQQRNDTDPHKKVELASLSKILTTHWSLTKLGLAFRFKTKIHVIPVDASNYDLHFEGGFDPVFSRDRLQYVIALLNNNKITKIRHISFDENFIFIDNLALVAASDSYPHDPTSPRTRNNLRQALTKFAASYAQTRKRALVNYQMNLPPTLNFQYTDIEFKSKSDFEAATHEQVLEIQSVPLLTILSEMNQHSNNHIADFIFQYLGGAKAYFTFVQNNLNVDIQNFEVRNGSGNPIRDGEGKKFYNSASCSMILETLQSLRSILAKSKLGLDAVFATAGVDADPLDKSPVSTHYSSPLTERALIAKTGTIDPMIGLAGEILTGQGDILFAILYGTKDPTEWKAARTQALEDITEILQKNEARPMKSTDQLFLSFDNQSFRKN